MKKLILVAITLNIAMALSAETKVIAHRGFHTTEGSARNSIVALQKAQELGIYGSECDVNLTKDGVVVVAHGGSHPDKMVECDKRITIQKSTLEQCHSILLENGEKMPTLDEYLAQTKKDPKTKLIIEIKSHATPEKETEVVEATLNKVKQYGLENQVEYIAFRPFVCEELKRLAPEGTPIAYLNGDYDPTYVKGMGLSGIDYKFNVLKKKPKWIKQAQKKGLSVNVWTVNKEEDIIWCIEQGVDYITTDYPTLVQELIKKYGK